MKTLRCQKNYLTQSVTVNIDDVIQFLNEEKEKADQWRLSSGESLRYIIKVLIQVKETALKS